MAMRWYVIHTYSGFEEKVLLQIQEQLKASGLEDQVERLLIPKESVVEYKKGEKVIVQRNLYPGYVLIRMIFSDTLWDLVKNTPKVTNFVNSGPRPAPLTDREVERILEQIEAGIAKPKPRVRFQRGERVKINAGPFATFTGTVDEINNDKSTLRVMVSIFGRPTPVEVPFSDVESV